MAVGLVPWQENTSATKQPPIGGKQHYYTVNGLAPPASMPMSVRRRATASCQGTNLVTNTMMV